MTLHDVNIGPPLDKCLDHPRAVQEARSIDCSPVVKLFLEVDQFKSGVNLNEL